MLTEKRISLHDRPARKRASQTKAAACYNALEQDLEAFQSDSELGVVRMFEHSYDTLLRYHFDNTICKNA